MQLIVKENNKLKYSNRKNIKVHFMLHPEQSRVGRVPEALRVKWRDSTPRFASTPESKEIKI